MPSSASSTASPAPLPCPASRPPATRPVAIAAVLAVVVTVFWRALHGEFVYDDLSLIAANPGLHDPTDVAGLWSRPLWGPQLGHWRPLTAQLLALGWWLGNVLGTGAAATIHALALLLHAVATVAVLALWRELGGGARGGIAAALLFALHPAQVESVAWCSALNDVLVGAATLLGLVAWRRWRRTHARHALAAAMLAVAVALAAKETGVVVPFLYLGSDLLLGHRRTLLRAHLGPLLLLLGYYLARVAVFGEASAGLLRSTHAPTGAAWTDGIGVALGLAARLPYPVHRDLFDRLTEQGFVDVAAAAALVALVVMRLLRAGPTPRLAVVCLLAGVLPPAFSVGSLGPYPLGERYLYVAVAGFALLLAGDGGRLALALRLSLAAAFAVLTFAKIGDYRDQTTLVAHALARHPGDSQLHYSRAQALLARASSDAPELLAEANQAMTAARQHLDDQGRRAADDKLRADVDNGLAWCLLLQQQRQPRPDWQRVETALQQVVARWPECADAQVGLGVVRASTNRPEFAELAFRRAIELDPGTRAAHYDLGMLLLQRGRRAEALPFLQEALRLQPDDPQLRELIAVSSTPR